MVLGGSAGLDVRATEPPTVGELETLPNVVLAPHVAGITKESQARIADLMHQPTVEVSADIDGPLSEALDVAGGAPPATNAPVAHQVDNRCRVEIKRI